MKSIYLLQSLETGDYKIGISKSINDRIKQLQTGNSSELRLITSFKSEHANKIEKVLHRKYFYSKKNGEWFNLSIEIENSFINECHEIEKNINVLIDSNNIFI